MLEKETAISIRCYEGYDFNTKINSTYYMRIKFKNDVSVSVFSKIGE